MYHYGRRAVALFAALSIALAAPAFAAAGDMILQPSLTLHWVTPFEQGNQSVVYAENNGVYSYMYVSNGEVIHTEREAPALLEVSPSFRSLRASFPGPAWWFDETRPKVVEEAGGSFSLVAAAGAVLVPPGRYDGGGLKDGDGSAFGVRRLDEGGNPKYGLLNLLGQEILPCVYDEVSPIVLSDAPIRVGMLGGDGEMRYGYAGWDGTLLTPIQYHAHSEFSFFDHACARVAVENDEGVLYYGYIDKSGREVVPCTYARAGLFSGGYAVVGEWDGARWCYGIIDVTGKVILPIEYEAVDYAGQWTLEETSLHGEYIWVRQDGKWGIFQLRNRAAPIACPTAYSLLLDGVPIVLDAYTVKDADGYDTNFAKLRDVAHILNGTPAQFNVTWEDGSTAATTGVPYTNPNGQEMIAPLAGAQRFNVNHTFAFLRVDGVLYETGALNFTDAEGGGHTYFRLRDLGELLGFSVEWDSEAGAVRIQTGAQ